MRDVPRTDKSGPASSCGVLYFPEWLCAHHARIGRSGFNMQQAAIQIDVKVPIGLMAHFYFLACVARPVANGGNWTGTPAIAVMM